MIEETEELVRVTFRTEPRIKRELELLASDDNRKLSQYIETVLKRHLAQERRGKARTRAD